MFSFSFNAIGHWIKSGGHWKYIVGTLLIAGAFLSGRYMVPTKTITQTITIKDTSTTDKNIQKETKARTIYVDRPVDHIITKVIVREPSGKTTETDTDATHQGNLIVDTISDKKKDEQVQIKTETVYKDRVVEKVVSISNNNMWEVGVLAGYGKTSLNYIPKVPNNIVLGGFAEKKILGNLKGGLWINSRLDVGVQLSYSF